LFHSYSSSHAQVFSRVWSGACSQFVLAWPQGFSRAEGASQILFLPAFPVRESRHDSGSLSVFAAFSSSHFGFYHPRGSRSPRALLARIKASFPFPVDPSAAECLGPLEHHVLLPEKRFCYFCRCSRFHSPRWFDPSLCLGQVLPSLARWSVDSSFVLSVWLLPVITLLLCGSTSLFV
jgi:hypothetical protein